MNENSAPLPAGSLATSTKSSTVPAEPQTLAEAIAGIRADSRHEPDTYLRDTVVPSGGE